MSLHVETMCRIVVFSVFQRQSLFSKRISVSNINTGSCLGNITISPYHIKLTNLYFII